MQQTNKIQEYLGIVEKVARVEQRRIPSHLVEYEELMSIGIIAIQALVKNKTQEQLEKYNDAYIATAIRWAIRNELRNRYKWYSLKHTRMVDSTEESADGADNSGSVDISPEKVREAVYETILSIEYIQDSSDNDSPFDFIKDGSALPDEKLEIAELGKSIREAIAKLPPKERTIVEYRFYRNLQIKDIATQVGLSSSRVTRIVQASLNLVREYLKEKDQF
ncbi:MAG: sigma-70 family RNA polymerase sigma factor [Candidatus Gastranaerophilales bacterium]|nr:sigma-70 family RNA polymerase sigma factor [Candidatus Gastranaerophilales bacterium]